MQTLDLVERFLRYTALEKGRSANTVEAYRRDLTKWAEFLGDKTFENLKPENVTEFIESQRIAGLASASITRSLSTIRSFHRFAVAEGVTEIDPTGAIAAPSRAMRLPKALTVEQVSAMLDSIPLDTPIGLRDKAVLELMYATGARVSEIASLVVDDVLDDGIQEFITVTGKGNKQRIVPVGSFAREALSNYLVRSRPALAQKGKGSPSLFLGARGDALSRQNIFLIIRLAADRAGIEAKVSPHTLRHSCATHLLRGGADIRVVQELLGHASVSTTQIYTLVTRDALNEAFRMAHPRARAKPPAV